MEKELTIKSYIIQNEDIIEFNTLPDNAKKKFVKDTMEYLSRLMSEYYFSHIDEFKNLNKR